MNGFSTQRRSRYNGRLSHGTSGKELMNPWICRPHALHHQPPAHHIDTPAPIASNQQTIRAPQHALDLEKAEGGLEPGAPRRVVCRRPSLLRAVRGHSQRLGGGFELERVDVGRVVSRRCSQFLHPFQRVGPLWLRDAAPVQSDQRLDVVDEHEPAHATCGSAPRTTRLQKRNRTQRSLLPSKIEWTLLLDERRIPVQREAEAERVALHGERAHGEERQPVSQ
eukprot:3000267-Rhodomonas_salina.2